MVLKHHKQKAIRRYLLQQLSESERQTLELRLLGDGELNEELERVEDELIDQYLANELSRKERGKFEEIFLANPERKRQLEAGQALKRYLNRHHPPPSSTNRLSFWFKGGRGPFFSPAITVGFAVLAVAVVGLIVWRAVFYQSDLEQGLAALNKAYRYERPIEARVSSIEYAPFVPTRGGQPGNINEGERAEAQLLLQRALKQRSAAAYHALGQFYVLQKDFDKAIENLERAQKADSNNAQIYADLGAAYLEKGKAEVDAGGSSNNEVDAGKGIADLGRSLENLQRALELDPNLLPALFNRALVLQNQKLNSEAEAAWRTYLEKDATSPWANDARQNLKVLEEKNSNQSETGDTPFKSFLQAYRTRDDEAAWEIYRRNHLSGGNRVTAELLNSLLAEGSNETNEALNALDYLGQLELRKVHDAYTSDLAKVYRSLTPATRKLVLQARNEVEQGSTLLLQSKIDDATNLFESALSTFRKLGNLPESLTTEAATAHGATVQPNLIKGQEVLAHVIRECESRHYKWLLAETIGERAHIQSNLNNYSEALDDSERALQLSRELQDTGGTLGSLTQLAGLHLFLNDNETSFSYIWQALAVAEKDRARRMQIWGVHITTSVNLSALQLHRAALVYQNEALQLALGSGLPLYISRSYLYIGLSYGALGNFDRALHNMHLAYEQGKPLASERNGQNMMANASLKLGDLYRASGDASSALSAYEESSRLYQTLGFDHYNYAAHKGKFLSYLALNNDGMAAQELQVVLGLFDEYREKILGERQKSFFFDREQDIYDLAIDFAYSRLGDTGQAYTYSEVCRARNLRELMNHGAKITQSDSGLDLRPSDNSGNSESDLSQASVQEKLPPQVQIVEFAVLQKKLLIWYLTRSKMVTKSFDVETADLSELVTTTLQQIIHRDENGAAASLQELDRLLIEPVRAELDPNLVLCFVPDKTLHYVPFGALISKSTGHYLAQDFRVMFSPSAAVLVESTKKARAKSSDREERLLAVGNPKLDRAINPSLANLPGAEREIQGIALGYSSPHKVIGPQATRRSIMAELPRADVAHFAAHYEIDPRSMLSSKLILASEADERSHSQPAPGLYSSDIYRMRLPRTKLVVLSACSTGIEDQFKGEGPIGFARSFLVAGVPVVVASLWPVDSEATAELMIKFHRFRKVKHLSVIQALKQAQQEMIVHENPLYRNAFYWAGFVVIGGYAEY